MSKYQLNLVGRQEINSFREAAVESVQKEKDDLYTAPLRKLEKLAKKLGLSILNHLKAGKELPESIVKARDLISAEIFRRASNGYLMPKRINN